MGRRIQVEKICMDTELEGLVAEQEGAEQDEETDAGSMAEKEVEVVLS
jgi:hypothetical protein